MDPRLHHEPPPPARTLLPGESSEDTAVTREFTPPPSDRRHFHHYEVCLREDGTTLHELGRGGMGVSYKARDVNLDILVAIKVIRATSPTQTEARERFRREARAAAQLRHPNVASVFHFGETPAGECFYAMEFIEGETLWARVQREGPLPAALVVEIALQVTAALIEADERGLVHRDLKPANLMLVSTPRGRQTAHPGSASSATGQGVMVKVIDFGLAKAAAAAGAVTTMEAPLTQEGGFLGTPAYASPEQAEGGYVDARSDIYSLGVTLWYLLVGNAPFTGRSFNEIYDRQCHRPLPVAQLRDAGVPDSLVRLLVSMLAVDPSRRPGIPRRALRGAGTLPRRTRRPTVAPGAGTGGRSGRRASAPGRRHRGSRGGCAAPGWCGDGCLFPAPPPGPPRPRPWPGRQRKKHRRPAAGRPLRRQVQRLFRGRHPG